MAGETRDRSLIALDDALETAAALRVSPETVMRDWKIARAWLTVRIGG